MGNKSRKNIKNAIFCAVLSSAMAFGTCSSAFGLTLNDNSYKAPDNSLVIGNHLFDLNTATNQEYNLDSFVDAAKTVDENNKVYYKYDGKWYLSSQIKDLNSLKHAKGVESIPNNISLINEYAPSYFTETTEVNWYQDGDYSHDEDGNDESIEQFVVYFNKPVKKNKGKIKIIVPDNNNEDPYGKGKLGTIEFSMENKVEAKALENVKGGKKVALFCIGESGKLKSKDGYTDRMGIELTEDWTRVLNTKETGIHYYDERVKGLKLVAEGFEDIVGKTLEPIEAKQKINLVKDDQKPRIVIQSPIYTRIGVNGLQAAGKTKILFNEPVQIFTEKNVKELKILKKEQPYVLGCIDKKNKVYIHFNPITPNQDQLASEDKGLKVFKTEYRKIDDNGQPVLGEDGKQIIVKGVYGKRADILSNDQEFEDEGDKFKLRMKDVNFKYDFDEQNKGITRFRDYGCILINPTEILSEGKWQLVVKNISDDAGNYMDEYVSDPIEITKYFTVEKVTKNNIKIKFTKPFEEHLIFGNRIPLVATTDVGKIYGFIWATNLKEGQEEVECKFMKPLKLNVGDTVYINTMECKIEADDETEQVNKDNKTSEEIKQTEKDNANDKVQPNEGNKDSEEVNEGQKDEKNKNEVKENKSSKEIDEQKEDEIRDSEEINKDKKENGTKEEVEQENKDESPKDNNKVLEVTENKEK